MNKVLFVDDEKNILSSIRRQMRNHFTVLTAESGAEGLQHLLEQPDIKVVVSDMRMPEMDGVQFLRQVAERAPDTIRLMLTGHADMNATVGAVNEGRIFRFLLKPWDNDVLLAAVEAAMRQHQLIHAERELLEKTVSGIVELLVEVMAIFDPNAVGRGSRIRRLSRRLAEEIGLPEPWQLELAATLSTLGCITLPPEILQQLRENKPLADGDMQLYNQHPQRASRLLRHIPRLDVVSGMIAAQQGRFLLEKPVTALREPELIAFGGHAVGMLLALDEKQQQGGNPEALLKEMAGNSKQYDPTLVAELQNIYASGFMNERHVMLAELKPGMVLKQPIYSTTGALIMPAGQQFSGVLIERLNAFAQRTPISEPMLVVVPN